MATTAAAQVFVLGGRGRGLRGVLLGAALVAGGCTAPGADDEGAAGGGALIASCPAGWSDCGTYCADLSADPNNCGQCAGACLAAQQCLGGECACQSDLTECGGACVQVAGDPDHCGECGNECGGGQFCSIGECTTVGCSAELTACGSSCVDLMASVFHCGECGHACGAGELCEAGECVSSGVGGAPSATGGSGGTGGETGGSGGTGTGGSGGAGTGGAGAAGTGGSGGVGGSGGTETGGTAGTGGSGGFGGGTDVGGTGGSGASGTGGSGGASGATGSGGTGGVDGTCGSINEYPLGCDFAWGAPDSGSRSSWLDFVSTWVGYESRGGLDGDCDACGLVSDQASSGAMVVYYTYFIGFQANYMGGFGDCNVDYDGHNLCSDGAQWIRDNWDLIVQMYATYAQRTQQASPSRPVIWWLEGDFVQYSYSDQSNPLSMGELGQLAREITCAIKTNQPSAVVAMNHSPWISDEQADAFWSAMPMDVLDLVWVQGPGDSGTLVNSGEYNAATANYAWLHQKTGRPVMAETSYAGSGSNDRWTTASTNAINQRIAEGVIAVLVNNPGSSYQSSIQSLSPGLGSVCQ